MDDYEKREDLRKRLSSFFSSLKAVRSMTRFLLVTGITRFRDYSPFSSLNTLQDITFSADFSAICGFTEDEIRSNYAQHITKAHKILLNNQKIPSNWTEEDLFGSILDWYDGYSWDGKKKVINPLSVVSFFAQMQFGRYWYNTGDPGVLLRLQSSDESYFKSYSKNSSFRTTSTISQLSDLSATPALVMTGYLTVENEVVGRPGPSETQYNLNIPNTEVRMSFAADYLVERNYPWLTSEARRQFIEVSTNFCNAFCAREEEIAENYLASIFAATAHQNYVESEAYHRSHIAKALLFARGHITEEKSKSRGEPDLVLEMRGEVMVIEVKYNKLDNIAKPEPNCASPNRRNINGTEGATARILGKAINREQKTKASRKPTNLERKELTSQLLDKGINVAFKQINDMGYAEPYLGGSGTVWAVAISVVGRGEVRIRFRKATYKT
jgi:hypothetical protein